MISTLCLVSADASLGRLEYDQLSQQTLMEMTVDGILTKNDILDDDENYLDKCEWEGVLCNEDGEVLEWEWASEEIGGTIDLLWLPPTIENIEFVGLGIEGTLETNGLPETIRTVTLSTNNLRDSVDLWRLPPRLKILNLYSNRFTGSVHLTKLPEMIAYLSLSWNRFSGSLDVTHLPDSLEELYLNNNAFTEKLNLASLPCSMMFLDAAANQICGTVTVVEPPRIVWIKLEGNRIERAVDVEGNIFSSGRMML